MRTWIIAAVAVLALSSSAFADEDSVDTGDGSIAVMGSGEVYQSNDGTDFGSWEGDDVTITSDGSTMIDHSTGEKADVDQIN